MCTACGAVYFLDPKVVANLITEVDGKIVMIRRDTEPGRGKWAIPGGFVDRGEMVEEGAVRELREETGLKVEVTGLIGVYSRPGDTNILVVYGGQLKAGTEAQEVGLFDAGSLPPLAFQRDADIIRQWRNKRG